MSEQLAFTIRLEQEQGFEFRVKVVDAAGRTIRDSTANGAAA